MSDQILSSLLALVTNPDAVAKNIVSLQAKRDEARAASKKAAEDLAAIAKSMQSLTPQREALAKREADVSAREAAIKSREDKVASQASTLAQAQSEHQAAVAEHGKNVTQAAKDFDAAQTKLQSLADEQNRKHKQRSDALTARETELSRREILVQGQETALAAKLAKLKQLAD